MKVFLSHSTKDKEFVLRLAAALEDADFKPWLCEVDIDRGENFVAKINEGLWQTGDGCGWIVVQSKQKLMICPIPWRIACLGQRLVSAAFISH